MHPYPHLSASVPYKHFVNECSSNKELSVFWLHIGNMESKDTKRPPPELLLTFHLDSLQTGSRFALFKRNLVCNSPFVIFYKAFYPTAQSLTAGNRSQITLSVVTAPLNKSND